MEVGLRKYSTYDPYNGVVIECGYDTYNGEVIYLSILTKKAIRQIGFGLD